MCIETSTENKCDYPDCENFSHDFPAGLLFLILNLPPGQGVVNW